MKRRRLFPVVFAAGMAGCSVEPPKPAELPANAAAIPEPLQKAESSVKNSDPTKADIDAESSGTPPLIAAKPAAKVDVEALLNRANRAFESGKLSAAVAGFEEVLKYEPENRRALSALAQSAQRHAMDIGRPQSSSFYLKSADAVRRLQAVDEVLNPDETALVPIALYNEACTLAVSRDALAALKSLDEAYATGFPRIDLVDTDTELDSLRALPAFVGLQRKIESRHIDDLIASFKPFPFDFTLPGLDGDPKSLSGLLGEVTIVDIWGTWCVPCRKEIPHLLELSRRYKDRGLRIVGVNYEKEEGPDAQAAVRKFMEEYKIDYPCVLGDHATQESIPGLQGYPTTLFLDKQGKVRLRLSGYQSLMALELAVQRLLDDGKDPTEEPKPDGQPAPTQGPVS